MSKEKHIRTVIAYRITRSIIHSLGSQEREIAYKYEFDKDGNKTVEETYSGDEPEQRTERKFSDGHLIEERIHFITDDMQEKVSYEYDEKGLLRKAEREYSDGSIETSEYEYNDGKLVRKVVKDDEGEEEEEDLFEYNGDNMVMHQHSEFGELKSILKRSYDEHGNVIEESRENAGDKESHKVLYSSSVPGRNPDMKVLNSSGKVVEALLHVYDENGKLITEVVESNYKGYRKLETHYSYDEQGRVIKEESLDHNGLVRKRVSREYDGDHIVLAEHLHEENPETGLLYDLTTEFEYEFF